MSRAWPRRIAALCLVATAFAAVAVPSGATLTDAQPLGANVITTTTIHPPNLLSATPLTALVCRVELTWVPPSTGAAPGGYEIWRSNSSGGPYTNFRGEAGAGATSFTDVTSLSLFTTYHYVVRSKRGSWISSNSNQRSAGGVLCIL